MDVNNNDLQDKAIESLTDRTVETSASVIGLMGETIKDVAFLKDVPVLSHIYSVYKVSQGVREYHFISKLTTFFRAFYQNDISEQELIDFKARMKNPEEKAKTVRFLMIQVDRLSEDVRAGYFGNLFSAYIDKKITWEQLQDYSFVLETMHPRGFKYLTFYMNHQISYTHHHLPPGSAYFFSAGLIRVHGSLTRFEDWVGDFFKYGIEKLKPQTGELDIEMKSVVDHNNRQLENKKNQAKS